MLFAHLWIIALQMIVYLLNKPLIIRITSVLIRFRALVFVHRTVLYPAAKKPTQSVLERHTTLPFYRYFSETSNDVRRCCAALQRSTLERRSSDVFP
jgi:hypothetical protein